LAPAKAALLDNRQLLYLHSMPAPSDPGLTAAKLRPRAKEHLLRGQDSSGEASPEGIREAKRELHGHRIERELRDEQLGLEQEELEEARQRAVELYDLEPVGYLTVDKDGHILSANHASVRMLGMERTGLLSTLFSSFVLVEDEKAFYSCWRKVLELPFAQSCELRLQPAGGAAFFVRISAIQAWEQGQTVCRMTISDITEQKRNEQSLRESDRRQLQREIEEWKRLALEAAELGDWDQDLQTGRITCSAGARAMLGFPEDSLFDWRAVVARIHPDDRTAFLGEVESSTRPESAGRCEMVFRVIPPNGPVRWLRFIARTFFATAPGGAAVRRAGVLVDITRQKEIEELWTSRAQQLEGLVCERTARLQETVAELEHFSYTLVHDLRAPLRSIEGFSDLLFKNCSNLSPTHQMFMQRAANAARRMDRLITDALSYNKIVRHNFVLETIDSKELLRELVDTYPQFLEARSCISITGPIPPLLGNRALLSQCFSNLLTNALKFIPPGASPAVQIFAQDKGQRVRIWFQDNGIGISGEDQKKLFQMFQRLSHDYEGTGIGLALVKKAAERMRGAVGVESETGRGSRFWVELGKAAPAV
jgi:PAS domain S-box-containing protein